MASETTTTTLTEKIVVDILDLIDYSGSFGGIEPLLAYRRVPQGSVIARWPKALSVTAAALGEGAGSAYANSAFDSGGTGGSATCGEVGVKFEFTELASESAGSDSFQQAARNAVKAIVQKRESDICTVFAATGSTIGSTATALTLSHFIGAIYKIRVLGNLNPNLVAVLDPVHAEHLHVKMSLSTGVPNLNQGDRFFQQSLRQAQGSLYNVPIFLSNEVAAANGSDLASCMFVADGPMQRGAFGLAEKWDVQVKGPSYDFGTNKNVMVVNSIYGVAEIDSSAACILNATATMI